MRVTRYLLILALSGPVVAGEPPGGYYENATWGYKIRVPRDWPDTAVSSETKWVASKHLGKRELEWQVGTDWAIERPEMWVVGFPHDRKGETANPYDSYKGYITGNEKFFKFTEDYEFVQEKETTVGGVKVTIYEIKRKTKGMARRVLAWVYHFDDIDFAVQFKVLEGRYHDYKASFRGCLKSFKRIERKKALGGSAAFGGAKIETRRDLESVPSDKRTRAFKDAVEAQFRTVIDALPKDWKRKQTKNFLLLTNADKKFVKATIPHTDAVIAHLEKIFGKSGMEYQPPFILRIFATGDQRRAYGKEDAAGGLMRDIATYSGKGYVKDSAYEDLNESLWARWLEDRHRALEATLPEWLKEGLNKYMRMVRTKGKKIGYAHDDYDRDAIRLQVKKGKYESLLTLMSRGIHDHGAPKASMEQHEREMQQRVVVLWLMREGNRGKYKNLIRDFVLNIVSAIEEFEKEWMAKNPKERAPVLVNGREILQDAWARTFGKWRDKDWDRFTTAWLAK